MARDMKADRSGEVLAAVGSHWGRMGFTAMRRPLGKGHVVFDQQPEPIYGPDGSVVGVDAWVRAFDQAGKELRIDPHRRIINPPTAVATAEEEVAPQLPRLDREGAPARARLVESSPAEAFYQAVAASVAAAPNPPGWRTKGTVTTVYADTSDGRLSSDSATYSTAREGGGTLSADTSGTLNGTGQRLDTGVYTVFQQFYGFDTSAINDIDIVSAIVLDLWVGSVAELGTNFTVEAREKNWGPTLTTADYVAGSALASQTLLASFATSGVSSGAYKTFTSEAAFLSASGLKTGFVYLFTSSSRQRGNNTPSGNEYIQFRNADNSGTTQDPMLTITHAAPPSPPMFTTRPPHVWKVY